MTFLQVFHIPLYWLTTFLFSVLVLSFHAKKRKQFHLRCVGGILALIGIETFLVWLTKSIEVPADLVILSTVLQVAFFLLMTASMVGFVMLTRKVTLRDAIFYTVAAYSLEHFSNCTKTIFTYTLTACGATIPTLVNKLVFNILFKAVIIFVFYWFSFRKNLTKYKAKELADARVLSISVINLLICLVLSVLKGYGNGNPTNSFTNDIVISVYAMFGCVLCLYLQFHFFIESKLKFDNTLLDALLKEQNKANQMSKENIELINIKFHDLKKQIIRLENEPMSDSKAKTVEEIKETLSVYDSYVKTGNAALDSILMNMYLLTINNKIDFTYFVDGAQLEFIESQDVVSLFDNLLDNAFEAAIKEEEKNRVIHLQVYKEKKMLFIHLRNVCSEKPKMSQGLPVTQGDTTYHGYGMRSIKRVVNKYDGNMKCLYEHNTFTVNIIIPLE